MKPDWKDAPPWAQWLAQDADGRWHWYQSRPHISDVVFTSEWLTADENAEAARGERNPNWRDTLERRPDARDPKVKGDVYCAILTGDLSGVTLEGVPVLEVAKQRRRLIEALRPLARAAVARREAIAAHLITNDDAHAARDLLRELVEWPAATDGPHEPTREELADLHEPEGEPWPRPVLPGGLGID